MYMSYKGGYVIGITLISLSCALFDMEIFRDGGIFLPIGGIIEGVVLIGAAFLEGKSRKFNNDPSLQRHRIDLWYSKITKYL